MNWRERLIACDNYIQLVDEFHSICWSDILNHSCLRDYCDICPVALLYDELKQKHLGDL